jgi:PQ loop repeat
MLTATQIAGFIGAELAAAAYVPQIWHLVRVYCSVGISRFAFRVWLGASLLVTTHAIATRAGVFIVLGGVQIVATTVILVYATKYASHYCASHAPGDFGAETSSRSTSGEDAPALSDLPLPKIVAPSRRERSFVYDERYHVKQPD